MKAFLSSPFKRKQLLLMLGDSAIVLCVFVFSYFFRIVFYEGGNISAIPSRLSWLVWPAVSIHIVALYVFELYNLEVKRSDNKTLLLSSFSVAMAAAMLAILSYLYPYSKIGRVQWAFHLPLTVAFLYLWRKLFFLLFQKDEVANNLLIIGNSSLNNEILPLLERAPIKNYKLGGIIANYKENPGTIQINGSASKKTVYDIVIEKDIRTIVTSENLTVSPLLRKELLELKFAGVLTYSAPVFYNKLTGKIPVHYINDSWFLFHNSETILGSNYWKNIKRLFDIFIAALLLILSAPLSLLCCLATKLTSKGPMLFTQARLGKNQKPFKLIKFRTMIADAEKECGPQWSCSDDPRVTKVGRVLRKTRLDEIPQLLNVVRGDMSLVGPRPIRKHFADLLADKIPYYPLRFMVKPGITGWAQVKHDYAGSEEGQMEKLQYDLFYVQNQSFIFDIYIILKTIQTILFRPGQ
jgi:exopolysaccharide biosynthesis polyprenyl glycosylphosphotransferase